MLIDGKEYEFPSIAALTLAESRVFTQETGLVQDEVLVRLYEDEQGEGARLLANPGFLPAMARIAYKREHPEVEDDAIVALVERQDRLTILASLLPEQEDEDAAPLEDTTSGPNEPSSSSSATSESTSEPSDSLSGKPSETPSAPPDDGPETTGTPASATSPASVPLRQVI